MAVNPKEKKMLQEMWEGAEEAANSEIPDGTYQFEVLSARFHMSDKGKPQFKTKVKVVGGDEEYQGKEFETNDNLETKENMGWFKRKLRRLNITLSNDFDDVIDGTVADELEGLVFEGQVKTKNDFMNLYVNRLIGGGAAKKEKDDEEEDEKPAKGKKEDEKESSGFEEGDQVTWGDGEESGEIVEILEDEGKARIQLEDETIVRKSLDKLKEASKKSSKKDKDEDEDEEKDEFEMPSPEDVEAMKAGKVREALEALGFEDVDDMKAPREVLHGFATLAEDPDAKIELSEVKPLSDALEVEVEKGESIKVTLKALSKAVQKKLG